MIEYIYIYEYTVYIQSCNIKHHTMSCNMISQDTTQWAPKCIKGSRQLSQQPMGLCWMIPTTLKNA